ncbi:MAG: 4-(cytidine 5'-diphospho)-2-C-methyl-D-erythritol kinase [Lachnospiraceae bacterium]|jgi:4-diphosphocytidyl-2-C-methyl-D-erythritol kinase
MSSITISAPAKINLTLTITGRRHDGYHLLESLFQSISLCDTLTVETAGKGFVLDSDTDIPTDDNIITAADRVLRQMFPKMPGLRVTLEKNIPQQAGLGGGSTDCAAYLRAANELCRLGLSRDELMNIGAGLGADVPFCVCGGTALVRGIGEIVTPVKSGLSLDLVIVKPPVCCSTPAMYRRIDELGDDLKQNFSTSDAADALISGDIQKLCSCLYNVFEAAADNKEISDARSILLENGASGVLLSGSGSSVFGIFKNEESAKNAAEIISKDRWAKACKTILSI